MSTKGAVAAVLGGLVFAGNLAATDVPATPQDLPKEKALSATNSLAGITTTQYIQLNFGKTAKAAESPAVSSIPAGVSEAAWNNPDINTKEGLLIAVSKLSRVPEKTYVSLGEDFQQLNQKQISLLQKAYVISSQTPSEPGPRLTGFRSLIRMFVMDNHAQAVIDEFNRTGYVCKATRDKNDYIEETMEQFGNLAVEKLGSNVAQLPEVTSLRSKERILATGNQIRNIYDTLLKNLDEKERRLDQINKALETMNGK